MRASASCIEARGSLRYGDAQSAGFRRRQEIIRQRAEAVYANAVKLWKRLRKLKVRQQATGQQDVKGQPEVAIPEQRVTLETAKRWVRSGDTPAQISRQILAEWFNESPRRIKQMIDKATRQQKEAEEVHRNLESRGYSQLAS